MTDDTASEADSFTCPTCLSRLPLRKAFILTFDSRIACPHCGALLAPVRRDLQWHPVLVGFFAGSCPLLIALITRDVFGRWAGFGAWLACAIIVCIGIVRITVKRVHFRVVTP